MLILCCEDGDWMELEKSENILLEEDELSSTSKEELIAIALELQTAINGNSVHAFNI